MIYLVHNIIHIYTFGLRPGLARAHSLLIRNFPFFRLYVLNNEANLSWLYKNVFNRLFNYSFVINAIVIGFKIIFTHIFYTGSWIKINLLFFTKNPYNYCIEHTSRNKSVYVPWENILRSKEALYGVPKIFKHLIYYNIPYYVTRL